MAESKKAVEAVRIALQTEKDGLAMYEKAARSATCKSAAAMFRALIDDEKNHIAIITAYAAGEGIADLIAKASKTTAAGKTRTIFSGAMATIDKKAKATADDRQAVKLAMDFEKKGFEFYTEAAKKATDPVEKDMFQFLTGIENQHFVMLQKTLEYLDKTGQWFLWDEKGLVEG